MRGTTDDRGAAAGSRLDVEAGRYQLVRLIARGGMAEVYRAKTHGPGGFEKEVALKRVLPHLAGERELIQLFLDEARLAARLAHPNVVQVFDFGESEGRQFLAMELLEGADLSRVIRYARTSGEPLPLDVLAHIAAEAAAGLHYAHTLTDERGAPLRLVHRDVSPSNLFLTTHGVVKLLDFGIAKAEGQLHRSLAGQLKGKHAYVAPEQIADQELTPAADLWSLGATLYEACTGVRVFERSNMMATLLAIVDEVVPSPRDRLPDMNEGLAAVILRCLERDRAHRYASADEVRRDLRLTTKRSVGSDEVAALVRRVLDHKHGESRDLPTPRPRRLASSEEASTQAVSAERPATPATPLAWLPERRASSTGARRLDGYLLEDEVGADATGVLYRARLAATGQTAFVVTLHAEGTDELLRRLEDAVEAQRALEHQSVLRVGASGCVDGAAYFASEPTDAVPLAALMRDERRLPVALAVLLAADALRGLGAAHDHRLALGPLSRTSLFLTPGGAVQVFGAGLGAAEAATPPQDLADLAATLVHHAAGPGEGPALCRAPELPLLFDAVLERLQQGVEGTTARRALVELTPLAHALEARYGDLLPSFVAEPRAVCERLRQSHAQLELARATALHARGPDARAQAAVCLLRALAVDDREPQVRSALAALASTTGWPLDAPMPAALQALQTLAMGGDEAAARRLVEVARAEGRWLLVFIWLARLARAAAHDDVTGRELLALAGTDPSAPFGAAAARDTPVTLSPTLAPPRSSGRVSSSLSRADTPLPWSGGYAPVRLSSAPRSSRKARASAAAALALASAAGGASLWHLERSAPSVAERRLGAAAQTAGPTTEHGFVQQQLSEGMRALEQRRFRDAVRSFNDVIARAPDSAASVDARFGRAHANAEQGYLDEALADYRDLSRLVQRGSDDDLRARRMLDVIERKKARARRE